MKNKIPHLLKSLFSFLFLMSIVANGLFAQFVQIQGIGQVTYATPLPLQNSADLVLHFDIEYPPTFTNIRYLNMVIADPSGFQQHWAIQNFAIHPFPGPRNLNFWVDTRPIGNIDGNQINNLNQIFLVKKC